jgi:hypothetical protein
LDGKAQARVLVLAAIDELAITIIEVEIARQLQWRWLFSIAPIAALLLLGQELNRHVSPFRRPLGLRYFSQMLGCEKYRGRPPLARYYKAGNVSKPILDLRFSK